MIRVVVVDDHLMFAESLARLLAADASISVVGSVGDEGSALELIATEEPDVVLVDYYLDDVEGPQLVRKALANGSTARYLMLTGMGDERTLISSIESGCSGFVTKDRAVSELIDAVRDVHAGEMRIAPNMLKHLLPRLGQEPRRERGAGTTLTPRERQVLELLATGIRNDEIARRLSVSVNTVRNHIQNVLGKLGAHSKLEAVSIAVKERIIDIPR